MKENKEKIGMKRLISNVFYILKYALSHDKKMSLSYIIGRCVFNGTGAFMDTFLLKEIIDIQVEYILRLLRILLLVLIKFC